MSEKSAKVKGRTGSGRESSDDIDALSKAIDEDTAEHEKIMRDFEIAMREFASDRSLETCLGALNVSIQMSNIRYKLFQSYMHYSRLLEREVTKLGRPRSIRS
ncbi:MAG TPA: hypothetical protein VE566_01895 [Nitrososphaeraceae archaeon]|jgi:hypothetical protein|nr:hypothetical protein [Nitrososphaeraceae archaeon]